MKPAEKYQKNRNIIIAIILFLMNLSCQSQNSPTYWKMTKIYREDKTPFTGMTVEGMQEVLDYNFHFIRKGDSLYFELPSTFKIDIRSFKQLSQLHIADREYYEMYDHAFSDDVFQIKFRDNATTSNSKNTIMEFSRISKEEFEEDINKEIARQKEVRAKINTLKNQLSTAPQIILHQVEKLPVKNQVIQDDKGNPITLEVPRGIELKVSGHVKTQQFGPIKIGTFTTNAKIYDLVHPQKNYGLKQLTIWLSTDPADFDLAGYKLESPDRVIFKEDANSVTGYELDYDPKDGKAIIRSVFCLKYKKVGQTHVFIYADVYRSQFSGNFDRMAEMNEILNFNYQLSENITIK